LRVRARLLGVALAVLAALTLPVGVAGAQGGAPPWMDTSLSPDERANLVLAQMTLEEKVALMTGDDVPAGQELAYYNAGIPRLGIPDLRMADIGPSVRFMQSPTTAFPMDLAIAATWNPELVEPLGGAVADEARYAAQHGAGPERRHPAQPVVVASR
jgi:beta-glucosidase